MKLSFLYVQKIVIKWTVWFSYKIQDQDYDEVDEGCRNCNEELGILVDLWIVNSIECSKDRNPVENDTDNR